MIGITHREYYYTGDSMERNSEDLYSV